MGATSSLQREIDAVLDADNEIKIFRRLRSDYFALKGSGVTGEELLRELEVSYVNAVRQTDPLRTRTTEDPATGQNGQGWQCPKVRFGRTELAMPIITCGGMRQQQTWRPKDGMSLADVSKACQDNFQAIVDRAMALGINHFETAKARSFLLGYGSSEMQFGPCLAKYDRASFILQTKIRPLEDPDEFRATIDASLVKLQVEYLDLFGFHGINSRKMLDWTLRPGGCMDVVEGYRRAGKIRWVGFSTHAHTEVIVEAIETGRFDYVNLHYQFVGSYHASGTWQAGEGPLDHGNLAALQAAARHDMGVFIISPNDKGGMLYKPSQVLVEACRPQGLTPIAFNNLWLWRHHSNPHSPVHTLVVGAARPSDFDEAVAAAQLLLRVAELVPPVEARLRAKMTEALGDEWLATWWKGLPGAYDTPTGVFVPHILWLWGLVKAWGMYDFCRARYATLEGNAKNWKTELAPEENLEKCWSDFVPGLPFDPARAAELEPYLTKSPWKNKVRRRWQPGVVVALVAAVAVAADGGGGWQRQWAAAMTFAARRMRATWRRFCVGGAKSQVPLIQA
ncbi:unnamed protein product [Phaeothamnion confervicola]